VPLALKVVRPCSGVGCVIALVFLCLSWSDGYFFVVLRFSPISFPVVCILLFLSRDLVCLGCWWSFLHVQVLLFRSTASVLSEVPVITVWHVLGLRMDKRPPAMEGSCEYTE
jgi:hypothetical protein